MTEIWIVSYDSADALELMICWDATCFWRNHALLCMKGLGLGHICGFFILTVLNLVNIRWNCYFNVYLKKVNLVGLSQGDWFLSLKIWLGIVAVTHTPYIWIDMYIPVYCNLRYYHIPITCNVTWLHGLGQVMQNVSHVQNWRGASSLSSTNRGSSSFNHTCNYHD